MYVELPFDTVLARVSAAKTTEEARKAIAGATTQQVLAAADMTHSGETCALVVRALAARFEEKAARKAKGATPES